MLIGLLSDTHVRTPGFNAGLSSLTADELPAAVCEALQGVDLILHAGDIYTLPVLDELEAVAPVLAAEGDDDPFESVNDARVSPEHLLVLEGVTIWVSHYGMWPEDSPRPAPDVIVYGHSHRAGIEHHNGIVRINPGSPTFPGYRYTLGTVGFLTVVHGRVTDVRLQQLEGGEITAGGTSGIPGFTS